MPSCAPSRYGYILLLFFFFIVFSPFMITYCLLLLPTGDNMPSSSLSNQSNSDSSLFLVYFVIVYVFYSFLDLNEIKNQCSMDRVDWSSVCTRPTFPLPDRSSLFIILRRILVSIWQLNARTFIYITNVFCRSYISCSIISRKCFNWYSFIINNHIEWNWNWNWIINIHTWIEFIIGKKREDSSGFS